MFPIFNLEGLFMARLLALEMKMMLWWVGLLLVPILGLENALLAGSHWVIACWSRRKWYERMWKKNGGLPETMFTGIFTWRTDPQLLTRRMLDLPVVLFKGEFQSLFLSLLFSTRMFVCSWSHTSLSFISFVLIWIWGFVWVVCDWKFLVVVVENIVQAFLMGISRFV